jgi:hypothetical protein
MWPAEQKLTVLNFPPYLMKTVPSYIDCQMFQTSFQSATFTRRVLRLVRRTHGREEHPNTQTRAVSRRANTVGRKGVLLYKQLIRSMTDCACPIWRLAARSQVRKIQVSQSKSLRIATKAPRYVGNRKIQEYLGIPFFAHHIRTPTESFGPKFVDVGNPLFRQLGRHMCRPKAD